MSPEEDDVVLEGLEEFFAEEQVAVQKKKKSKKLKDGKAAKTKRRKKEVTPRAFPRRQWQALLGCLWVEMGVTGGSLAELVPPWPWEVTQSLGTSGSCPARCSGVEISPVSGLWGEKWPLCSGHRAVAALQRRGCRSLGRAGLWHTVVCAPSPGQAVNLAGPAPMGRLGLVFLSGEVQTAELGTQPGRACGFL